jgi:hypothetical protein
MKSKLRICSTLLPFVLLLAFVACNKSDHANNDQEEISGDTTTNTFTTSTPGTSPSTTGTTSCPNAPSYGDSIVYPRPKAGGDFFALPNNNTGVQGTYLSWPEGLRINPNSGAINLSQSETGVRYKVAFVKKGTTDTCVSQLIVGGMSYIDAIYVLDKNDTLAKPIFNADPFGASICDPSDDTDYPDNNNNGNNQCAFDNASPGQRANDLKLRVRTKSGIINLKKSVDDGLFGTSPRNGAMRTVPIQYQLNDASGKAPQTLTVQVMYFDKVSSIPVSLIQEVSSRRNSMFTYQVINGRPRPPYLLIAGLSQ